MPNVVRAESQAVPFYISNAKDLFRGDVESCIEREEFLKMCFAEIQYAPKCPVMGSCFNFQPVDDYCLKTKRVFTVYEDVNMAFVRGEGEEPRQSNGVDEIYFEGKPMKRPFEVSTYFTVTDEFKEFFEEECPINQMTKMYQETFIGVAKKMEQEVKTVDKTFEALMWSTLLSSKEYDMFGDPIWGDHPTNVVPYTNLYTGKENALMRTDLNETTAEATVRIHNILMNAKLQFEEMRNPFNDEYMYCRENCIDVYVSRCQMDYLIRTLELEAYAKTDSCCSNFSPCQTGYNMPRLLTFKDGSQKVSPFALVNSQFRFVECPALDQRSFETLKRKDAKANNFFRDVLDVNLDSAWLMVFPDRIRENKILQKHFYEVPGSFIMERRTLAKHTAFATYGKGWFDIIEGTGMILYTGK